MFNVPWVTVCKVGYGGLRFWLFMGQMANSCKWIRGNDKCKDQGYGKHWKVPNVHNMKLGDI